MIICPKNTTSEISKVCGSCELKFSIRIKIFKDFFLKIVFKHVFQSYSNMSIYKWKYQEIHWGLSTFTSLNVLTLSLNLQRDSTRLQFNIIQSLKKNLFVWCWINWKTNFYEYMYFMKNLVNYENNIINYF